MHSFSFSFSLQFAEIAFRSPFPALADVLHILYTPFDNFLHPLQSLLQCRGQGFTPARGFNTTHLGRGTEVQKPQTLGLKCNIQLSFKICWLCPHSVLGATFLCTASLSLVSLMQSKCTQMTHVCHFLHDLRHSMI